jgi:DNA-directed RNA polymerase subunit beta'
MIRKQFEWLQVMLASPDDILSWSHGSVESPDTINYRTWKPKQKWLFCEAIFWPMKNYECSCGKYKWVRYKGIVCERCGVEVTTSRVRRERMGHIELAAPVVHVWYIKATPSRVWLLLNLSVNDIEKILYFVKYVVTWLEEQQKKKVLNSLDKDYLAKVNELDTVYEQEKLTLAWQASTKKPKDLQLAEDETRKLYTVNKAALEKEYSRIKSILANLKLWSTILESDYRNIFWKFDQAFTFASGSQAILSLLKQVNVWEEIQTILNGFFKYKGEERKKAYKKLKLLISLSISGVRPEWMVLTHLPVIPPDLRPVVQLDGGRFASSDVNLFYRRVLMRNLRLKKMIQVGMPDVVKKNEIRLLQEAVNNLLIGEKANTGKYGAGMKVFKSLTDMLSWKEGIFRKNLLGKRVDYSGRSVITVWPNLKLNECGLPLYVAVKIFTPFIIGKLIERKIAHTPKQAEKLIKDESPLALKILEEVIEDKYVLLNRAPTLHRLSIQAFKVKLMPWKTIRIHPLVCPAFNADFDGDQMAVHLPLSIEAQSEAANLIAADQNVLNPASGDPVITHSQDMVLWIYYLTDDAQSTPFVKGTFASLDDVLDAFHSAHLHIKDKVRLRVWHEFIETTVGRVYFNSLLPDDIRFINETITKKWLKKVLDRVFDYYGKSITVQVADALKDVWFAYATRSTMTMNVFDLHIPEQKWQILHLAGEKANEIHNFWFKWFVSDEEKHRLIITTWSDAKAEIEKLVKTVYKSGNDIFSSIESWARGTWGQMTQMAGMKWLVSSPSWEIIELPIKSSLLEWFTPIEYFISAHGARKGKADTALRTAESGYLTRRLVDATQEIIIREEDCGTQDAVVITREESQLRWEPFFALIFGRVLAADAVNAAWIVLVKAWEMIDKHRALLLVDDETLEEVKVRNPLTCHTVSGVCQHCFGMDLSTRELVEIWIPIGVLSSQSIGEPGTQLTMRTFHWGGVWGWEEDITQGIKRVDELLEVRTPKKPTIIAPFDGVVTVTESPKKIEVEIMSEPLPKTYIVKDGYIVDVQIGEKLGKWSSYATKWRSKLKIKDEGTVLEAHTDYIVLWETKTVVKKLAVGTSLKVKNGAEVYKGQTLSGWSIDVKEYMKIVWDLEAQRYVVKEIKKVFTSQWQEVNDKYMETVVKQLFSKVMISDAGNSSFIPGTLVQYEQYLLVNEELIMQGKQPSTGERLALWLTNIAKESDSWMSAASFQETVRVMVDASIRWAIDHLNDLKSNVIIGNLLPVGDQYKKMYYAELQAKQWLESGSDEF